MQKPSKLAQIPQIRFAGFTKPWEVRKLGDCAKFSKGSGYSKNDLCNIGTPIILYGRLYTKYETIIKKVNTFVRPKDSSVYSKGGEIIIPASGETANDIARASAVENSGILLGGDLNIISPDKAINSAFLALSISNGKPQKELAKKAQGKSVVHISNSEIKELNIPFPQKAEQQKIGELFANLDNLITLHQRKFEKLQKIKKSCLQNLFPQNNQNTPKIRFKNFSDEWVEKKFSDIAQTRQGLTYKPLDIRINGIRVLRSSNINEDKFIFDNTDVFVTKKAINIDYVKNGDILITSANGSSHLVGKHAIIKNLPDKSAVHGGFMLLVTANNTEFLNASIGSAWYQKFISLFVSGGNGAIGNLSQNDLNNAYLPIPNSKEQEKIGTFFSKLDKLIALHQRKVEKLKEIKAAMLSKAFI